MHGVFGALVGVTKQDTPKRRRPHIAYIAIEADKNKENTSNVNAVKSDLLSFLCPPLYLPVGNDKNKDISHYKYLFLRVMKMA